MAETVAVETPGPPLSSASTVDDGRFVPGTVLGERYRIMSLLGRGGMGEVYRATDLKLGQQVALKFLPESMARDPKTLDRFHNEVRIARQVSHPSVCRVYDIGELDGHPFLSMEYVDGEDLGSLLRRIGRLPADKATEMARKLCAGLAAAHDKGVLHRDLKPANVMIDSRGQVVITDFGLAAVAGEVRAGDVRSGTPQYMAPEQLSGAEVTTRSDLYSLGLVLYEMFTGRRAFDANSLDELRRMQEKSSPASPSTVVRDMDPAAERVILRCLQADPKNRPASALAVAIALPGGDPLAAALAAGEMPSPELVAASGETEGLSRGVALACLAAAFTGLLCTMALAGKLSLLDRIPFDIRPEVLAASARETLGNLGYTERPVDSASSFRYARDYIRNVQATDPSRKHWESLASGNPPIVHFWYRESPQHLEATSFFGEAGNATGAVSPMDPRPDLTGMAHVSLGPNGRLLRLQVTPPQFEATPGKAMPVDWHVLFAAAGLDTARFRSAEPQWTPPFVCDRREAWVETGAGSSGAPLRIEAAAWRGRPVYFEVIYPWTRPLRQQRFEPTLSARAGHIIVVFLMWSAMLGACLLARRNVNRGRGDRRGAFRLAIFALLANLLSWLFKANHIPTLGEVRSFLMALNWSLFLAACLWLLYLALEPSVRQRWPKTLISWSRLLAGHFSDPLVGRDLLFGTLFGISMLLLTDLGQFIAERYGALPSAPRLDLLTSPWSFAAGLLNSLLASTGYSLLLLFLIFVLRALLRRQWLVALACAGIFTGIRLLTSQEFALDLTLTPLLALGIFAILIRYGLVALVSGLFVFDLLGSAPLTGNFDAWYAAYGLAAVAIIAALAVFGFKVSLAGRPLLHGDFLDS
jgi:predicted Ser/Thr protein kinase